MKKLILIIAVSFSISVFTNTFAQIATPPSLGDGSSGSPYEIATLDNLYWLTQQEANSDGTGPYWSRNYVQTANIDASSTSTWDDGNGGDAEGLSPIGNSSTLFTGSYNGQGHIIDGLYINRSNTDYIGLFGKIDGANIDSLGVINANVTGRDVTSILAALADNSSSISNSYTTGTISGKINVGGFIGASYNSSNISDCYSFASVTGTGIYNAGFVGTNHNSTINNSYSTGNVSTTGAHSWGGFCGTNNSTISNCFWDLETSNQATSAGGEGKTTATMKNYKVYTETDSTGLATAWDFVTDLNDDAASDDKWDIDQENTGYPILTWQQGADTLLAHPFNGSGTQEDPFEIATLNDLRNLSELSQYWDKHFIQTADINATATNTWNVGDHDGDGGASTAEVAMGFSPIGNGTDRFTGAYNGKGFIIENLYINRPLEAYIALFGMTNGVLIENVGLKNIDFTGANFTAGIVGENWVSSTVSKCFTTGTIIGNTYVGGITGANFGLNASVIDCHSSTTVTGGGHVGGLVGSNLSGGIIKSSYCIGSVTGTTGATTGGLVGHDEGNEISNSFWNTETSTQATSAGGNGKTTAAMKSYKLYTETDSVGLDAAWDFIFSANDDASGNDIWDMDQSGSGYPVLTWQAEADYLLKDIEGDGIVSNPYEISNLSELGWLSKTPSVWDKYFVQTANIDATATNTWNVGDHDSDGGTADAAMGFSPIGNATTKFSGTYNGQGYTIDALFINRPANDFTGLFGYISNSSLIDSLGITNANITGNKHTGGIAGYSIASIINHSYSTGSVTGVEFVGGIVGNNRGDVNNSYNAATVSGNTRVGGIVGDNYSNINKSYNIGDISGTREIAGIAGNNPGGVVSDTYNKGNISASLYAGGVVGSNYLSGELNNSYSTGMVVAGSPFGGLVGYNNSIVSNSFWDTEISGQATSAGGTGKTTAEMQNHATFTDETTTGLTTAWDFITDPNDDAATNDIWDMHQDESGYPILSWQDEADDLIETPFDGSGTEGDPYQIADLEDLKILSEHDLYWDKDFIQTADIDALETSTWNGGEGFSPIGNASINFRGTYNGKGHIIDNIYINNSAQFTGVFGYIRYGAIIDSIGVTNVDITCGHYQAGALVGANSTDCIVRNSFSTGSVSGDNYVGGLVGENIGSASIINSYSSVNVSGTNAVGGLVGRSNSNITNSYCSGTVICSNTHGGLLGHDLGGSIITNSFWNVDTDGITGTASGDNNHGATGKTTAEMQDIATFTAIATDGLDAAWDFTGTENDDVASDDIWNLKCGYPYLSWQSSHQVNKPAGSGTEGDPYQIATLCDLYWLSQADTAWSKHYIQTADIDASETSSWDDGKGFSPIGNNTTSFIGSYNGKGFSINSLSINRPLTDRVGLFGGASGASIDSLVIIDANITGDDFVGALVGASINSCNISYCSSSGLVYGARYTGGLIGSNEGSSSLSFSYSSATVTGVDNIGGLLGFNYNNSTITNCFSSGSVSGSGNFSGGLIGRLHTNTTINNCYSTSSVSNNGASFGGLIGDQAGTASAVTNCFWDTETSGQTTSAAGTGKSTYDMKATATYTDLAKTGLDAAWDFATNPYDDAAGDNIWGINPNENNGYPFLTWQGYTHTPDALAAVTTQDLAVTTLPNATGNGTITDLGFPHAIEYGICWNTTGAPTIGDSKSVEDTAKATGAYTSAITGLEGGTTYYYRAYSTNNAGTVYGNELSITTKLGQSITFEALANVTYGDADITPTVSASSALSVSLTSSDESVATIVSGKIHIVGAGSVTISANQIGDASYYAAAKVEQSLTISAKELTISGLTIDTKTYDGTTTASYSNGNLSGLVSGDVVTFGNGTVVFNDAIAGADKAVTASGFEIGGADFANYSLVQPTGLTGTINKAPLTVTANNNSKLYGSKNPDFLILYSGFISGEDSTELTTLPTATSTVDTASNVDTYDITVSGGTDENYSFTYVNGTLTINKAPLSIAADNKTKVFGTENPILTVSYSGFMNNQDSTAITTQPSIETVATSTSGTGSYDITVSGATASNYEITYTSGSLTITKATLSATAENKTKTYGSANPEFTITYSGFVGSDDASVFTIAPTATSSATASSSVGSYNITVSGGVADNYSFTYTNGTLSVEKATLTATAVDKSKTYGEANPDLTVTYSGFVNSDDASVLTTAATASTTAADTSNAGTYDITVTGGEATNYAFTYVSGTLSINKASQTISIDTIPEKIATDAPFDVAASTTSGLELTYSISGGPASINGSTISLTGTAGTVTVQAIQAGNLNYLADSASLSFEVVAPQKHEQSITFAAIDAKTYGASFDLNASSSLGLEVSFTLVSGSAELTGSSITLTGAGEVVIEATQNGNDTVAAAMPVEQSITVNKASLTITADDASKNEGEANPEFTMTFDGFVLDDTSDDLDELPSISCEADESSEDGTYDIVLSGGNDANYDYTLVNGTLTIIEVTGINALNANSISIYPNPTSNFINIANHSGNKISTVEIYNTMGELVYSTHNLIEKINVCELNSGSYMLIINNTESLLFIKD